MTDEVQLRIRTDADVLAARQKGRQLATQLNLSSSDQTVLATAISEIARNIVTYAGEGEITMSLIAVGARRGVLIVARDEGPGIPDIARAMQDGYSTSRSLGLGLPGSKRLMDEFEIRSEVNKGTTVRMIKWAR